MIFMQKSVGLPDVHSGYGFAIGELELFDNLVVRSFTSNKRSQDFVSFIMPRKNLFIVFLMSNHCNNNEWQVTQKFLLIDCVRR